MDSEDRLRTHIASLKNPKTPIPDQGSSDFAARFNEFRPRFEDFVAKSKRHERRNAPKFNIFELLRVERDEAVHSRFLASLLDPSGSHGQGALFLNSFLRFCEGLPGFPVMIERDIPGATSVFVRPEFSSAHGRPDILVFSHKPAFALIVENKIDAQDETTQLARYWKLLQSLFKFAGARRALIYLTPSGRKPRGTVPATVHYFSVSYQHHIADWLRSCVEGVAQSLKPTLSQYAHIAANLSTEAEGNDAEGSEQ